MPAKTLDEIKAMIAADDFAGVTLDTSIFDQYGCDLQFRTLLAMKQFRNSGIHVILSAITASEVRAHLTSANRDTAAKLKQALNQYNRAWKLGLDKDRVGAELGVDNDPAAKASAMFEQFLAATGAAVLPIEPGVSIQRVVDLYFDAEAPFSDKDGKKSEFPDAIALLSLEAWAREHGAVLAISRDSDWQRYAERSPNIVCIADYLAAMALFNDADRVIGARVATDLREGRSPHLQVSIDAALEQFVEIFDIEAESADHYEEESAGANVLEWSVSQGTVNVVAADDETLTLVIKIDAEIEFTANFRFSHWDSIDREYVRLASTSASTIENLTLDVAITVDKGDLDDPDAYEVSVENPSATADFGTVEPDWR